MKRLMHAVALTAIIALCSAHIGSPDAWYEGSAGPYKVLIQVVTPNVVPGVATVYVRLLEDDVTTVGVQTNRYDALDNTPPPEAAKPVDGNGRLYSAPVWVMSGGSNGIIVSVTGARGSGRAVVPVVVVPTKRLDFDKRLGAGLSLVLLFLVVGAITIIGAAVRESVLPPGAAPDAPRRNKARTAMAVTAAALALILFGGMKWWAREDAQFTRSVYKPFTASAAIANANGAASLHFSIADSIWRMRNDSSWLAAHRASKFTPLILDHGKLMHLFLVKDDLTAFAHLHPMTVDSADFVASLPPLPAGRYRAYGDIVHESGFTQTLSAKVAVPAPPPAAARLDPDDAWLAGAASTSGRSVLADGSVMTLERGRAPVVAGSDANLKFAVRDSAGKPVTLEPYIGMAGHAVVTRDDGSVFVHLHPSGTISMASQMTFLMRTSADSVAGTLSRRMSSAPMLSTTAASASDGIVAFPYAFPRPGSYHVWVQVKHAGRPLTGAFALEVSTPAR